MRWGLSTGWANADDEFEQRHAQYCAAERDLHDRVRAEIGLVPTRVGTEDDRIRYGLVWEIGPLRDASRSATEVPPDRSG